MTFSTTRTRDADLIEKARDLLQLFTLAVPASQAITVLKGRHWDVMKLGYQKDGLCSEFGINKEKFHERMKLLCHRSLKEIGDLILCYICIVGDILVALGPVNSVKGIRIIVKDCIVRGIPPASRVKLVKDAKVRVQTMKRLEDLRL
ncbi:KRR1 small subunit processome component-like [Rosa rugosa]|uniref:KRR1 small subunit processome component-like n=1 Tax=Rosa rugosa TaxID=74645 RepID=UPI002B4105B0|nr:KRR1 small subunit processome component-like [Rosa rugosa]